MACFSFMSRVERILRLLFPALNLRVCFDLEGVVAEHAQVLQHQLLFHQLPRPYLI